MTKFAGAFAGRPATFDNSSAADDELLAKLHYDVAHLDNRTGTAETDHSALHQELARVRNLLKASEASKSEMLNLLCTLSKIAAKTEDQGGHRREIAAEADRHLSAVHDAFGKIAKSHLGKTDVFASHLLNQMESLAAIAIEAASKGVMRVTNHEFTNSQLLLDAFGAGERILRYTWLINPSERLFGEAHWRRHFELTSSLAISHAIQEIQTVLLVEHRDHLDAPHVQKLLEFFATQERLNAKIVLNADYAVCAADHAIPAACLEFGLYGDRLLYQADGYQPVSIGSWSKDAIEIARFGSFFGALWNTHTISANNPAAPSLKVGLAQLMAADSAAAKANATDETARIQFPGPV
jgi:hypothetical protein